MRMARGGVLCASYRPGTKPAAPAGAAQGHRLDRSRKACSSPSQEEEERPRTVNVQSAPVLVHTTPRGATPNTHPQGAVHPLWEAAAHRHGLLRPPGRVHATGGHSIHPTCRPQAHPAGSESGQALLQGPRGKNLQVILTNVKKQLVEGQSF